MNLYDQTENNKNTLTNFGDPNFEKLAKKYKILSSKDEFGVKFFGDSHLASDDTTNAFREAFFKQNSIGFAMPLMPKYHLNQNLNYVFSEFEIINSQTAKNGDFPLCGVIAKSKKQGATINLELKQNLENKMEFEILHKSLYFGKILHIKDSKNQEFTISQTKPNLWQYSKFKLYFPVKITSLENGVEIGGYKIYKEHGAKFADTCAINGAFSSIYEKWRKESFKSDFSGLNYDLVVIGYGTNDAFYGIFETAKFYKNLQNLIRKIRNSQKNAVILLLSPPPSPKAKNMHLMQKTLEKIAKNEKTLIFDTTHFINLNGGLKSWQNSNLAQKDDVHLARKGYEKIGLKLAKELKKILK